MITVHSYTSYKLSAKGFEYGAFVYDRSQESNENYKLSSSGRSRLADTAFSSGIIRKVCGKIPASSRYIILVKRINHIFQNKKDDFGKDISINIAFEFDEPEQFSRFTLAFNSALNENPEKLSEEMAGFIRPDPDINYYGYDIDRKRFNCFMEKMLSEAVNPDFASENERFLQKYGSSLSMTAISPNTDYTADINRLFGFDSGGEDGFPLEITHSTGSVHYFIAQKKTSKGFHIPRAIMIILIITVLTAAALTALAIAVNTEASAICELLPPSEPASNYSICPQILTVV